MLSFRCFGPAASILQPGKRNFAGRDWRANSGAERGRTAEIQFADRPRLANLPESRGFLSPGKSGRFARTGWWWRQSCQTGLYGDNSLVTGKKQGISNENAAGVPAALLFLLLNQSLAQEFPARENRGNKIRSRKEHRRIREQPCAGKELSGTPAGMRPSLLIHRRQRRRANVALQSSSSGQPA